MTILTETAAERAPLLPRVSTPEQALKSSLDTQERAMRERCAARGYVVDERYVLAEAVTGTEFDEREQIQRLRQGLADGDIDVVLFYDVDRAARDQAYLWVLYETCRRHGARLEFVLRDFEDTPFGRFALGVHAFQAEFENDQRLERTNRAKNEMRNRGQLVATGTTPFGYRRASAEFDGTRRRGPVRYEVHPEHATTIERIIRLYLGHGQTLRTIVALLNAERVTTPAQASGRTQRNGKEMGGEWTIGAISRLLTNPAYYGQPMARRYVREKHPVSRRKVSRWRSPDDWKPIDTEYVPPLLPPDLRVRYEEVLERLHHNKLRSARNNQNPEASLLRAGFVRCGECGKAMAYGRAAMRGPNRTRQGAYLCQYCKPRHQISGPALDAAVWSHVRALLTREDVIERKLAEMNAVAPERDELASTEAALKTAKLDIAVLVDELRVAAGPISKEMIRSQIADLEQTYEKLEKLRIELLDRQAARNEARQRVKALMEWCQTVAENIDELTYEQRRLALSALRAEVTIWRSTSDRRWRLEVRLPLEGGLDEPIVYETCRSPIQLRSRSACTGIPTTTPPDVLTLRWSE